MEQILGFLTEDDHRLLNQVGETRLFEKDEIILEEGDRRRIIHIILEGKCRVERSHFGRGVLIAGLEAGEFFGEMSFLEGVGASATVVADGPGKVLCLSPDSINSLLQSVPGLSTRFYQSIAVNLSKRLRDNTAMLPSLLVEEVAEVQLFHKTHVSTDADLPKSLVHSVESFKANMVAIDQEIFAAKLSTDEIQVKVNAACTDMKDSLNKHIEQESLFDEAVGSYVFRETFPFFMSGRMNDRCYTKPRGYSGDYETIELIYENFSYGNGRIGRHIDRWTLNFPSAAAVRNRRQMIKNLICSAYNSWDVGEPMPICSVASGPAREVFDLLTQKEPLNLKATCLDIDDEAIGYARGLAEEKDVEERITFGLENVVRLALGRGRVRVPKQKVMYSMGLIDYLETRLVVTLLDWIYDTLVPGGVVALGNFASGNPDKPFLDHVMEWVLIHRTPDQLREIFKESKFGDSEVDVLKDESGVQLLAVCHKS